MTNPESIIKPTGAITAEMELTINGPRKVVWDSLINDIGQWWRKDFYAFGKDAKFVIDLKLGGHMYEDAGGGAGVVWFTILGIWPEEKLYVIGHTRPPFGGPASGLITFELEAKSEMETVFKVSDTTFGCVTEDLVASSVEGWKMIFDELKKHVEKS